MQIAAALIDEETVIEICDLIGLTSERPPEGDMSKAYPVCYFGRFVWFSSMLLDCVVTFSFKLLPGSPICCFMHKKIIHKCECYAN
jgi:hypothetical protein